MNVMTCREMEMLLRDLVPQSQSMESNTMDPQAMPSQAMPSEAAAHLAACPRCSAELERERRVTASLAALAGSVEDGGIPGVMPAMHLMPTMEARLRAAFREHWRDRAHHRTNPSRPVFELAARKPSLWVAGAAAIIVVSLGVALGFVLTGRQPSGALVESPVTPTAALANPQGAAPVPIPAVRRAEIAGLNPSATDAARPFGRRPVNDLPSADATPVGSQAATASPVAEQAVLQRPPQVSSEFVPLFYGGDPQLLEAGQVWRVEMPRGALQSVGMPVVEESRAGRIQVDILLGEDGIARAIRLVQ